MPAQPTVAPYGAWKSPITSSLIVAQSISLMEVRLDGDDIYWLEGRPQEKGRYVVVRASAAAPPQEVNAAPYNARTRVHEYGGASWVVAGGAVYFSNFSDGRLYRQERGAGEPVPLTPAASEAERNWRYADGLIDRRRRRWIGVREDHSDGTKQYPDNAIVAVALDGAAADAGRILASGHDFFSSPRLSPDGRRLAYLAWDHPNMPWVGTTLYVVELGTDGVPAGAPTAVAGGPAESLFQPEWSPDGTALVFASDRTGWWNLYWHDLAGSDTRPLAPMEAEFGQPQWVFGLSTYAFAGRERIVAAYVQEGLGKLAVLDIASGRLTRLDLPFSEFSYVQADGDRVVFRAGAFDRPPSIVRLDLASLHHQVLRRATEAADDPAVKRCLARVQPVQFPTEGGRKAFGLYYPPTNPDYIAPPDDKPPLVVRCHGGPTAAASSTLNLGIHYWTSRGIAVLDVNYGGSTGYGRAYRDRLHLSWGIVDVDDAIAGAKFLAAQGFADARRSVITGGSAGGYTALAALTFRDYFAGGASHFGVSDAAALAKDTHKFESRYLDWLIGPYPAEAARYKERSPAEHAQNLTRPVIFFQGDEDRIVPPSQTERMVEALRRNRVPVGYFLFSGEQHGFRQAANIQRALDAELYFYSFEVFGTQLSF